MNELASMVWIEERKALRSRIPLFTAIGSLVMPLAIALLLWLATNPGITERLGLIGAKANLVAYASTSWPTYFGLLAQMVAAGVFLISCLVVSWVFGREFADHTLKDMLAVPVRRSTILLAKFIVVTAWTALLALLVVVAGLVGGALLRLPGGSPAVLVHGSLVLAGTSCLVIVTILPFALFASIGRGYLLPVGVALFTVLLANLAAVLGLGPYFPWAIPGLYAQGQGGLAPMSYPIIVLTGLAGMAATYLWWKYADQSR
jgi:ABC-2 type transport system permease protein